MMQAISMIDGLDYLTVCIQKKKKKKKKKEQIKLHI